MGVVIIEASLSEPTLAGRYCTCVSVSVCLLPLTVTSMYEAQPRCIHHRTWHTYFNGMITQLLIGNNKHKPHTEVEVAGI